MDETQARLSRLERSVLQWRAMTALACVMAVAAFLLPLIGYSASPTASPPAGPAVAAAGPATSPVRLSVERLTTRWLEVQDDGPASGAGVHRDDGVPLVHITSASPQDHSVILMVSPHGADVTVSSQAAPRQFGSLKIMDRKPYLQMHEEGRVPATFYQAPIYAADGTVTDGPWARHPSARRGRATTRPAE